MGRYILNDEGIAIPCEDLMAWALWLEGDGRAKWRLFDSVGPLDVSTVFLGLDHQWGKGDPLLWETMIFNNDMRKSYTVGGKRRYYSEDQGQWRFSFKEEAYRFHRKKVRELKRTLVHASEFVIKLGPTSKTKG